MARAAVPALFALLLAIPAHAQYKPIPNYVGVGAGAQFRKAINDRLSGAEAIAPTLAKYTYANLPQETDGQMVYCTDCMQSNPCGGAGTGAVALGQNGAWTCTATAAGVTGELLDATLAPYYATGSNRSTTAGTTAGSQLIALAAAKDFANGQHVCAGGVGPNPSITAPTPSVSTHGTTGSTTLAYKVALRDTRGGITAVGSSAQVSNANGTSFETDPNNYESIRFTFPAGTQDACIYRAVNGGSYALVATHPSWPGGGAFTWYDYNVPSVETITDSQCPSTPPGSGTHGDLCTTITYGGGTTTLTLASAPSVTTSSASFVHDDTLAIQNALNDGASSGKRVYLPAGNYHVRTLYLNQYDFLVGSGNTENGAYNPHSGTYESGATLWGTAGFDTLAFAETPSNQYGPLRVFWLNIDGGENGIHVYGNQPNPGALTDFILQGVHISNNYTNASDGLVIEDDGAPTRWFWSNFTISSLKYAILVLPTTNQGIGLSFKDFLLGSGASGYDGEHIRVLWYGTLDEYNGSVVGTGQNGHWISGPVAMTIVNPAAEAEGAAQTINGLSCVNTTGSINSGSGALTVASATGFSDGDTVTVDGAGSSGQDLYAKISSIAGTTLHLDTNAGTTVTSVNVTNAPYADWVIVNGASPINFIGGAINSNQNADNCTRYALDAGNGSAPVHLINVGASILYDRWGVVSLLDGSLATEVRGLKSPIQSALNRFTNSYINVLPNLTVIPANNGGDLILSLQHDGSGNYGRVGIAKGVNGSAAVNQQWDYTGVSYSSAPITTLGGTSAGNVYWSMPEQGGTYKKFIANLQGYENTTATAQTITFPTAFAYAPATNGNCTGITASTTTLTLPASMGSTQTGQCIVEGQ